MAVDDSGNQRIAFEWGNFPLQPNDDRTDVYIGRPGENNIITDQSTPPELGAGDSHIVNATAWNQYPEFAGSRNYAVTDAEYLGSNVYEFTSENELQVGDRVVVSNAGDFSFEVFPLEVIYADKLKFQVDTELNGNEKVTGLRARVDVIDEYNVGHTRYIDEGAKSFLWPSYGFCYNTFNSGDGTWQDMIEYLRDAGVDPERLVEATFEGGDDKYDYQNGEYAGGVIFWDYIPADNIVNVNWETGEIILGKDLDGYVIASENSWGDEIYVNPESDLDISFVAFTNDPAKDTSNWWY